MELNNYIKTSLYSIITAISEVQESVYQSGIIIFPSTVKDNSIDKEGKQKLMNINFDIAVTVDSHSKNGKGMSINVVELLSGSMKSEDSKQNQSISRISFEVPIAMPILDSLTTEAQKERNQNLERIARMI